MKFLKREEKLYFNLIIVTHLNSVLFRVNMNILENLKKHSAKMCNELHISCLILFGSYSNNSQNSSSDIDIAYYSTTSLTIEQQEKLYEYIEKLTTIEKIDIIDLKNQDLPLLRYEILSKGVCLYEEFRGLFDELEYQAWSNYVNYLPEIKEQQEFTQHQLESMNKNE